jgi:hypothetical protein
VTENEIKAEVRLYALECVVSQLAVTMHAMAGSPFETFAAVQKQMLEGTRNRSFPDISPAESDLYSAELENAVGRLLDMQGELLEKLKRR